MTSPPPEAVAGYLRGLPMFSAMSPGDLKAIADLTEYVTLPGGDTLMMEGEPADALYIVRSGRLRAFVDRDGSEVVVGEIGPGELVGEMAVLSHEPRSATVRALRDTHLLQIRKDAFEDLLSGDPDLLLDLTRLLVTRLHRSIRAVDEPGRVRTLAVVGSGGTDFAEHLVSALEASMSVTLVDSERARRHLASGFGLTGMNVAAEVETVIWLHSLEADHELVVYRSDPELTAWTELCMRQADRILLIANASDDPQPSRLEQGALAVLDPSIQPVVDLVLVHPPGTTSPSGTARWLQPRWVDRHHHVRTNNFADIHRLARIITGRARGLVFSGGGARGYAHLGVLKAIFEAGMPVDLVGGASFGSTIAVGYALGLDYETLLERERKSTVDIGSTIDFTFPAAALSNGRRMTDALHEAVGDSNIEDLWYGFFCVSSDLTTGELHVHTEGPAWKAVRASVAIPGIFPPMRSPAGHVLVDGGVMNNLPVDVMREFSDGGTVMAVDVRARSEFPSGELTDEGSISGWRVLGRRLNPIRPRMDVPRMIDVLLRSTEIASEDLAEHADFLFTPDVERFAILDFKSYENIIQAGYEEGLARIKEWRNAGLL